MSENTANAATVEAVGTERPYLHFPTNPKHPRLRYVEEPPAAPGEPPASATPPPAEPPAETPPGDGELGDKGKRAIDAMKAERDAAKTAAREALARAEAAETALANKDKPAEQVALDEAEKRGSDAATKAANERVIRSEIKAAAALKLTNPDDALAFINPSDFTVDENGEVDQTALKDAVDQLLVARPYLAAANAPRFDGAGDGGAGAPPKPNESLQEALAAAVAARNFALAATLRTQIAAEAAKKG